MQASHAFTGAATIAGKHAGKAAIKPAGFQAQSIARLACAMEKITARHAFLENTPPQDHSRQLPFNIPQIDSCLGGGLARNALHEIRTELSRDIAAGSGFLLGLLALAIKHRDGQISCGQATPQSDAMQVCLFRKVLQGTGLIPAGLFWSILIILNPLFGLLERPLPAGASQVLFFMWQETRNPLI